MCSQLFIAEITKIVQQSSDSNHLPGGSDSQDCKRFQLGMTMLNNMIIKT